MSEELDKIYPGFAAAHRIVKDAITEEGVLEAIAHLEPTDLSKFTEVSNHLADELPKREETYIRLLSNAFEGLEANMKSEDPVGDPFKHYRENEEGLENIRDLMGQMNDLTPGLAYTMHTREKLGRFAAQAYVGATALTAFTAGALAYQEASTAENLQIKEDDSLLQESTKIIITGASALTIAGIVFALPELLPKENRISRAAVSNRSAQKRARRKLKKLKKD